MFNPHSSIYQVESTFFQGPIEVLYQLIQKNELDITEISLAAITKEYLQYIQDLPQKYQERVPLFLEIASHLVYIKSKSLLPFCKVEEVTEEKEYTHLLLERILFFSRLEKGLIFLRERFLSWNYQRARNEYSVLVRGEYSLVPTTVYHLVEHTVPWLKQRQPHSLSKGEIKSLYLGIEERWEWIVCQILDSMGNEFFSLVKNLPRIDQIISFLSLLEKVKQQVLMAEQKELFAEIILELKDGK